MTLKDIMSIYSSSTRKNKLKMIKDKDKSILFDEVIELIFALKLQRKLTSEL